MNFKRVYLILNEIIFKRNYLFGEVLNLKLKIGFLEVFCVNEFVISIGEINMLESSD